MAVLVLTGTWLDRGKPLPGLFFLLLLLLLVPPPLMVLPPDILRFRRLFGACLDGSAAEKRESYRYISWGLCGCVFLLFYTVHLPGGATILCHFWKRQVLRQSLGLRLYVLCLDISSCMGSRITHSWRKEQKERRVSKHHIVPPHHSSLVLPTSNSQMSQDSS